MNKRILKKAEEDLRKANSKRRERVIYSIEYIEKEVNDKVEYLLKHGMKKKYLNKLCIYNTHSLPKSYKYRTYYTHYCAELNKHGNIKKLTIEEDSCIKESYGGYEVNYNIDIKYDDFSPRQINESLRKQIICGNL